MTKIIDIESNQPHKTSEVICVKCFNRYWCVRPVGVWLRDLECQKCGPGFMIETGQEIDENNNAI